MTRGRVLAVVAAAAVWLAPLDAQTPLQTDVAIRAGTLTNGLQYFLQSNPRQRDRLVLELVVRAGSIDEADDQRGVAHLLEHMAFNGSTHFKPGEMLSYFQSIGARIGPHVNAFTNYESTTYVLDVPIDRDGAPGRAFDAVRDVAGGLAFEAGPFDRERRVIVEEWRGRLGVAERQRQPELLALFGGSPYANRRAIGDPERLPTIPLDRVRDFYRDYYRSDRMALVAVGGLGVASLEGLLHASFDDLSSRAATRREVPSIPDHAETRYAVFADPEAQATTVGVVFTRPNVPVRSVEGFRRFLVQSLATNMIASRFTELARRPDTPFLSVATTRSALLPVVDTLRFNALVTPGKATTALSTVLQEIGRAREHGFSASELDRARLVIGGTLRQGPGDNRGLANGIVAHFLREEPTPSPLQLLRAGDAMLPAITLDEVRGVAREIWSDSNRLIVSTAMAGGSPAATEADLRRTVSDVARAPVLPPWQPTAGSSSTRAVLPPAGTIQSRREIPDSGVTVLTLSNGVEVWLKPTLFNPGEVIFRAQADGGGSLAPPADFPQAMLSPRFVAATGVGGVPADVRARELAGRPLQVRPTVTPTSHGIFGSARATDLETALNLVHFYFTSPNRDATELARQKTLVQAGLANQDNNPAAVFSRRLREINTGDFYMLRPPTAADVARVDPMAALEFFADRFGNAANFTFVVAGSFTVDSIAPLLEKYVASLPSKQTRDMVPKPPAPTFPAVVTREVVRKGREPRSQIAITYFADTGLDAVQVERANGLAALLQTRLYNRLRTSLGGTYNVAVGYSDITPQRGFGTITIAFASAPENTEALTTQALDEVAALRVGGPTADEVAAVKAARAADLRTRLSRNDYWVDALVRASALGRDASTITREPQNADAALTVAGLADAARRYLPSTRYTVVTLLPEQP